MQFRKTLVAATAALLSVLAVNSASALRVDLLTGDSPGPPPVQNAYVGTTVHFDPGTYVVTYATGGNYQAYDQCGVQVCINAHTDPGFQDGFAISGGPLFSTYYNIALPPYGDGNGVYYATAAEALAAYQAAEASGGMFQSIDNAPYVPVVGPISFTLLAAADINFNMQLGCCWDNVIGGMSLDVTRVDALATPLPAALPMFGGGLAVVGLLARRRRRKAA